MREIKFRVFDNISNKLHDWNTIRNNKFKDFDLEHYNLMQYTGLKDKNGVEIYEGDIVLALNQIPFKEAIKKQVVWKGAKFVYEQHDTDSATRTLASLNCEVIGNIHQNKELL